MGARRSCHLGTGLIGKVDTFFYFFGNIFLFPSIWRLNCSQVIQLQQTANDIREIREGILKSIFLSHCFFSLQLHPFKQTILCTQNLSFILLSKHKLKNLKASKLTAS